MEFSPNNPVVKLCLQAMELEGKGNSEEAKKLFLQAWREATNEFEKFIAAYFIASQQENASRKLHWFETALQLALSINDEQVNAAFPVLYESVAECYEELNNSERARKNRELANSFKDEPSDKGPFYHGTRVDLKVGDFLTAGYSSNYSSDLKMNHIYFTAFANGAGLAAALAKGDGQERVYIVEPTGSFENDPNVTNKKFPGNPTRSYRTESPLKIVGELTDWMKQTSQDRQKWREKLDNNKGNIIN
jgi:tetratricopeptide (TPR) repeat protein